MPGDGKVHGTADFVLLMRQWIFLNVGCTIIGIGGTLIIICCSIRLIPGQRQQQCRTRRFIIGSAKCRNGSKQCRQQLLCTIIIIT